MPCMSQTSECEFADELFISCIDPDMLEELYTEEEVARFTVHLGERPLCPFCVEHLRPWMELFAGGEVFRQAYVKLMGQSAS